MKTLNIPSNVTSFCLDNSCDYFRSNDSLFRGRDASVDLESSHNFFAFRISC